MKPEATEREKAFNELFTDWATANKDAVDGKIWLSRAALAQGAMAVGWNAALKWTQDCKGIQWEHRVYDDEVKPKEGEK